MHTGVADRQDKIMWQYSFWKDTAERVIRSFAWTLGSLIIASKAINLFAIDWLDLLGTAGLTALLAFCGCLAGRTIGNKQTAAFTREATAPPLPAATAPSTFGGPEL